MQNLTQLTHQLYGLRTNTPMLDQTKGDNVEFNPNLVDYNNRPKTSEEISANRNKLEESLNDAATILVKVATELHVKLRRGEITPEEHMTQCRDIDEIACALVHNESLAKYRQTLKEMGFPDTFDTKLEENEYQAIVDDLQFQQNELAARTAYRQRELADDRIRRLINNQPEFRSQHQSADERIHRFINNRPELTNNQGELSQAEEQLIIEAFRIEEINRRISDYRATVEFSSQIRAHIRSMRPPGTDVGSDRPEMDTDRGLVGMEGVIVDMLERLSPQARAAFNFQPLFSSAQHSSARVFFSTAQQRHSQNQ